MFSKDNQIVIIKVIQNDGKYYCSFRHSWGKICPFLRVLNWVYFKGLLKSWLSYFFIYLQEKIEDYKGNFILVQRSTCPNISASPERYLETFCKKMAASELWGMPLTLLLWLYLPLQSAPLSEDIFGILYSSMRRW